jgi:enamine deaminase RidA (YjgF/YER057c/UK114 family)
MKRTLISSGTEWEKKYGYSRAVHIGNVIMVSGTTAVDHSGAVVGAGNPYAQAKFIYQMIDRALREAGSSLRDVVRVRTFVVDISRWEEVARAQGEVFSEIRPAATLVQVNALVKPELLVEIEVDAVIHTRSTIASDPPS